MLSYALQKLGRREEEHAVRVEALRLIDRHLLTFPTDEAALGRGAIMAAWLGQRSRAIEFAERSVKANPDGHIGLYNAACTYCLMNRKEDALDALAKAWRAGFRDADWARRDPDIALLRGEPEFERLFPETGAGA